MLCTAPLEHLVMAHVSGLRVKSVVHCVTCIFMKSLHAPQNVNTVAYNAVIVRVPNVV